MTSETPAPPETCQTMAELRAQIDRVDAEILNLLAQRVGYIDQAIVLKTRENLPALIEDRVAQVIANVRKGAGERGLDPGLAERVWTELVAWAIAHEDKALSRRPETGKPATPRGEGR
ncbi:MAG: chorismate mutase family protein [Salinarimonadaceae bacterium]|nr:MAG: chorismate mutase family protein [Salinarimonadaceae bacterium]